MNQLSAHRREAFCQAVASGMSASRAYAFAYARQRNAATRASAARLLREANVRRLIAEHRRDISRIAGAALELLIPQLEEAARTAIDAGRLREASRALERLAA